MGRRGTLTEQDPEDRAEGTPKEGEKAAETRKETGEDAAKKAAEEANKRLRDNPWTENPDAAKVVREEANDEAAHGEAPETSLADVNEYDGDEGDGSDEGSMSILRHLEELRSRIITSLAAVAVGAVISYIYIEDIMRCITLPTGGRLYYLQPAEAFFTYIKIACFAGFLLALPVVFYQAWKFVLPALTVRERTVVGILVPSSVILFFTGLAFSFFLVLPAAMQFFMGFGSENLMPMFTLNRYFDFVLAFILPFGAVFELPLIVIVFAKLGFIGSEFLASKQRIVIFLAFVVGAVISPTPDIFTQSMIAVPLILLYEISYLVVRFVLGR